MVATDHLDREDTTAAPPCGAGAGPVAPLTDRTYAALDLGTNNCRLLIARPCSGGFRVVDSFSRIVRLGEGLSQTGRLSDAAISRTIEALRICRDKIAERRATRTRLIATEACRAATNGAAFIAKVEGLTGLKLEVVDRQTEAGLATTGCAALADTEARSVLLFDIGGGSSEVIWLTRQPDSADWSFAHRACGDAEAPNWTSLRLGVVTLAERFGGRTVTEAIFEAMVTHVRAELAEFAEQITGHNRCAKFHLLGTSGTVTTLAGVHLNLSRYDRRRVDGLWMSKEDVDKAIARLRGMTFDARARHGCIGPDRADLVLAGCAIFEAIRRTFPSDRVRIADRGLREGLLIEMMRQDGCWQAEAKTIEALPL